LHCIRKMLNLLTKFIIMKKRILLLVAVLMAAVVSAYAQPRAIGGRIGYGFEVSYQHSLAADRMINLDAGLPAFHGIEAVVTHDWINPFNTQIPWDERGEWNWYLGVGGGLGWYWGNSHSDAYGHYSSGAFTIGVAGRVGVEYNFWFPMQLSIDWRPVFGPGIAYENGYKQETGSYSNVGIGYYTGGLYAGSIAIGIRYLF